MRSAAANSKTGVVLAALLVLAGAAWGLAPVERRIAELLPNRRVAGEQLAAIAGRGKILGVLGGLRSVVAGGFWLRTNLAWEQRDLAATTALIEATVAADERPVYFWLNGARMMAFDMPEWRGARGQVPDAVWRENSHRQVRTALAFLEKGVKWQRASADIYVEMANLHLRRLDDVEMAARYYRLAAEQPDAPYYAARIYAELLSSMGREAEALAWLRRVVISLPRENPVAGREVVEERIRALELRLGLPRG